MRRKEQEQFKEIIGALKKVKVNMPEISSEKKEENIIKLLALEVPSKKYGNLWDFIIEQITFINGFIIIAQLLWGILFVLAFQNKEMRGFTNSELFLFSMSPPILLILVVEEIARVYNRSMLEIECTTKYSIKKLILLRMLVVSIGNILVLVITMPMIIPYLNETLKLGLGSLLLYGLTPLVLMTWMILIQMEKRKGEQLLYRTVTCYVILLSIGLLGGKESINIYRMEFQGIWLCTLVTGALACVLQFKKIYNEIENFNLVN